MKHNYPEIRASDKLCLERSGCDAKAGQQVQVPVAADAIPHEIRIDVTSKRVRAQASQISLSARDLMDGRELLYAC